MIPYDDLVTALQNWRVRQGLPVSVMGGSASGPAPVAAPQPGSGPKSAPPVAVAAHGGDDELEPEMIEEHDAAEAEDYLENVSQGQHHEDDATSVGTAPGKPPRDEW